MSVYQCPVCGAVLNPPDDTPGRVWRCAEGHHFDVARQGHVNLLPVQFKHSRNPGDTPEAVQARQRFLGAGHYAPLREAVRSWSLRWSAVSPWLLDVGCGEGYYTTALCEHPTAQVIGVDIAKPAILQAARQSRHLSSIQWLVASGSHLPLGDQTMDAAMSLFAPVPVAELDRVLKPDAELLVVRPAAGHLYALRRQLFDQVVEHDPAQALLEVGAQFDCLDLQQLTVPLELDPVALQDLLAMTPYVWKARPERQQAVRDLPGLQIQAVFFCARYRRRGTA